MGSYPTTGEGVKRTSEAPSEDIVDILNNAGYRTVEGADAVREAIRRFGMGKEVYE